MALSKEEILDAIAEMTVMDVVELVSAMEEKFGVSAAAAVAAAPAAAAGDAPAAEEKTEFDVVLSAIGDKKVLEHAVSDLQKIAGQKPVVTKARKSIAGFKVREEWPIGCKVTLRGERMYEFLERLVSIAIPRIRDFRGISPKQFDGRGNFSMGVNEQIIFPEIEYDKVDKIRGMDVTITTTAKTNDEGRALLKALQFPFRN